MHAGDLAALAAAFLCPSVINFTLNGHTFANSSPLLGGMMVVMLLSDAKTKDEFLDMVATVELLKAQP